MIWDLQRNFYDEVAIGAWSEAIVPNFVTTNAFLAATYAKSILGLLRDMFEVRCRAHAASVLRRS